MHSIITESAVGPLIDDNDKDVLINDDRGMAEPLNKFLHQSLLVQKIKIAFLK